MFRGLGFRVQGLGFRVLGTVLLCLRPWRLRGSGCSLVPYGDILEP